LDTAPGRSIEGFAPLAGSAFQVFELPASTVGTDEEELGLAALIRVGDSVRPPPARSDAAHARALGAAEHANVPTGSAIRVHVYIIAQRGQARYWPNGGLRARPASSRKVAGVTKRAVPSVWSSTKEIGLKGSQKPKSAQKKPAQKTLKERRSAKKAAAKIRGIAE
jgi:hypothetical protein